MQKNVPTHPNNQTNPPTHPNNVPPTQPHSSTKSKISLTRSLINLDRNNPQFCDIQLQLQLLGLYLPSADITSKPQIFTKQNLDTRSITNYVKVLPLVGSRQVQPPSAWIRTKKAHWIILLIYLHWIILLVYLCLFQIEFNWKYKQPNELLHYAVLILLKV